MEGLLSREEKRVAARFLRSVDRDRYVVAHGILRQLLGRYLSREPVGLVFETSEFGKPMLVFGAESPLVSFNIAHSGDVILYAIASGRRVGVDVEAVRSDRDWMELAESQFSAQELEALQALDPVERAAAFYRCWTLKEAYVKARGEGLGFPLKQFSVTIGNREMAPAVQWASDDPQASERWSVFELSPAPGYAGALIVEGRPMRLIACPWRELLV
jgi:4'-phosphopantetheinyl transferase